MKISPKYQHKDLYIQMMNDLVAGRISGIEFSDKFLSQRSEDLDASKTLLSKEEKAVISEAESRWMRKEISYEEYLAMCNTVVGPINNLFLDLYDIIQSNDIEDFTEYFYAKKYRCVKKSIEKDRRVNEKELRRRIKEKLDILEANKGKW